ncbi:MAG TPA: SHOCT domain-containing protein [Candidatus Hydromicrobium sp.]
MMMWPNMMSGIFGGWGIIGMILMFIFWALLITGIILLVVWIVRRVSYPGRDISHTDKAMETLKERYARGEVTKEEFERIKKDIS